MRLLPASLALLGACTAVHGATLSGRAVGVGPLTDCAVQYTPPGAASPTATALTDASGAFTIEVGDDGATAGAALLVTGGACADSGTGLPAPVALGAVLPAGLGTDATVAVNGITTLAYYTSKNAAAPQVSPYLALMGGGLAATGGASAPSFDVSAFYGAAGAYLGIPSAKDGATADLLGDLLASGSAAAAGGYALSTQVLAALAVGSQGLAGFKPDVAPDAAAEAMVIATFPAAAATVKAGQRFDLTRPPALTAVINKALGGAPQDVVTSAAGATADLNAGIGVAVQAAAKAATPSARAAALEPVARAVRAAQETMGPAARAVAAGTTPLAEFNAAYGTPDLVDAAVAAVGDAAPGVSAAAVVAAGKSKA